MCDLILQEYKMSNGEKAVTNFQNGCNCAQAVVTAYAEETGLDKKHALAIATGFGGGIGRTQDVCGAVSGAIMILGLKYGSREGEGREKINATYSLTREFIGEFSKLKGTIKCKELLDGCNLSTEEGQAFFREHNLREKCWEYVRHACEVLDGIHPAN